MRTTSRRRLDVVFIGGGALFVAGIAAIGAVSYNEERIDQMSVGAALHADGTASLHEVIDYDFGNSSDRHGLLRRIPGLTPQSPIGVASPDGAPDSISSITDYTFDDGVHGVEIRVGDATITVSGRHRYDLDYGLDTLIQGGTVAWDAVGTDWDVAVEKTEVDLVAPFQLDDPVCQVGFAGSTDPCSIDQVEPGHLVVRYPHRIRPGHGITVRATRGADISAAPALPGSVPLPDDPGAGVAEPSAVTALAALGGGLSMSRWVRRAGRERVGVGGATDAAFTEGADSTSERLVDAAKLGELATTDFAPPDGVTAPMGGIVLAEAVHPNHKVAWLLEAAISGAVDMDDGSGEMHLTRKAPGAADVERILDTAFGGRDEITLGKYDATFAGGWQELGSTLETWSRSSGLWDAAADRRRLRVRVFGALAMIAGVIGAGVGGAFAGRWGPGWLVLAAGAALVAGGGWAAALRGWELRVRTPRGSAVWLRVESFRRFLHDSEAYHAEEAAKRGVLREYTAWAVAVGEIDRWKRAVESSSVIPETAGLSYLIWAPILASSTTSASTAPSSSGGGGFGGGGVGGGGGGGGGGSW